MTNSLTGPFTVFIPTNQAFERLSPDLIQQLQSNTDLLNNVLSYHTIPGLISAGNFINDLVARTTQGGSLRINNYGRGAVSFFMIKVYFFCYAVSSQHLKYFITAFNSKIKKY